MKSISLCLLALCTLAYCLPTAAKQTAQERDRIFQYAKLSAKYDALYEQAVKRTPSLGVTEMGKIFKYDVRTLKSAQKAVENALLIAHVWESLVTECRETGGIAKETIFQEEGVVFKEYRETIQKLSYCNCDDAQLYNRALDSRRYATFAQEQLFKQ